ncbi:hypothetical protein CAPTEDRAFT_210545, partial [Capitella teleta]
MSVERHICLLGCILYHPLLTAPPWHCTLRADYASFDYESYRYMIYSEYFWDSNAPKSPPEEDPLPAQFAASPAVTKFKVNFCQVELLIILSKSKQEQLQQQIDPQADRELIDAVDKDLFQEDLDIVGHELQ